MARDPFGRSPLFRAAAKKLQAAARREFRRSALGQMLTQAERLAQRPSLTSEQMRRAARQVHSTLSGQQVWKQLRDSEVGKLASEIERYAKGDTAGRMLMNALFSALGPAGTLLKSLIGTGRKSSSGLQRELDAATRLLRSFGYEVLPPSAKQTTGRQARAAKERLEELGYTVLSPEAKQGGAPTPAQTPQHRPAPQVTPEPELEVARRPSPPDSEPVKVPENARLGLEMIRAYNSSNVWAFGYDARAQALYIRFKADNPKGGGKSNRGGSMYRYDGVPEWLFRNMKLAASKGKFIWDHIRIRGTHSGHRYDYHLVGVSGGYVPRKATYVGGGKEAFIGRSFRTNDGRTLTSVLPDALAPAKVRTPSGPKGPSGPYSPS